MFCVVELRSDEFTFCGMGGGVRPLLQVHLEHSGIQVEIVE